MRLENLSKFAATSSPVMRRTARPQRSGFQAPAVNYRTQQGQELQAFPEGGYEADTRDVVAELSQIRSAEDLVIDHSRVLSLKRGDLAIIKSETFHCTPAADHLQDVPLVVKRLECVDRRTYDLKVYEADSLARFAGHPNILTLYSYWSEKPSNPYTYKTLVLLTEEGVLGDLRRTVVDNPVRPSATQCLLYGADLLKGISALHNVNIVHGRIKPVSVMLDAGNHAMLGELGRTELDSARQTHQLFSKVLIGDAIPHTLVYWAPELLTLKKYGKEVDMWALGVTLYELATGRHPFDTSNEVAFRDDVISANVDWEPFRDAPEHRLLASLIKMMLRLNPEERITASEALSLIQRPFALKIQAAWRGYRCRRDWLALRRTVVLIQSHMRRYLTRKRFSQLLSTRRTNAATLIASYWRGHKQRTRFTQQVEAICKCQALVISRQTRQAYLRFRANVIIAQSYVRRYLARQWYRKVQVRRRDMEAKLLAIQTMVQKYNEGFVDFQAQLSERIEPADPEDAASVLPVSFEHLRSFEDFELSQPPPEYGSIVCLPKLRSASSLIGQLRTDNESLQNRIRENESQSVEHDRDQEALKEELGSKYFELDPMIESLKKSLARVEQQCRRAIALPVSLAHEYAYSRWEKTHEPDNRVENVLEDDEAQYRALSPSIDMALCNGSPCFVSEVVVCPGECGPAVCEVYTATVPDQWVLCCSYKCSRDTRQVYQLPGEQTGLTQIRLRFPSNIRGGNIVSVRHVEVKGLVLEQ
ncbi:hypothetical protein KIPB_008809 [Kipferlia bialata]|uniref:non-specific serine/threonine protein kinase n=1 Tax=Kipferlia bialata TaxID=797122 RepID=A0A9K3GK60_9EUKA|nr:hypothetical protein KIPB_008809 [Kipferlia bialata]|eukprot:g8809.t1